MTLSAPGVRAPVSHRTEPPTLSEMPVCVLLKSTANANRRRLDNFRADAEQRHRVRLRELLDFVRGRCRRRRDDFGLPELRQAYDSAKDVDRSGRGKCGA